MLGKHINHCENSLTASVFTHLLHLPAEMFWQIFRKACYTDSLPEYPGEPLSVNFWPKWDPAGTCNSSYVEPDLFMCFNDFDLIIEAKVKDSGTQCPAQLARELITYTDKYGNLKRSVRMIAVGGIHTHRDDTLTHKWLSESTEDGVCDSHLFVCPVHMCKWSALLLECQRMERDLRKSESLHPQTHAHLRILADLIDLFAWHGYANVRWFSDFDFNANLLSPSAEAEQKRFRDTSLQFKS